ncbi:hypothetical protein XI00_07195 [Bradyrhizobium sp. CCBAU 21359]|nr:hypothetical protein [Bradyrhizobium sp. CCBAU 21360]MDA9454021.1 hypothetical protein [Bradyrhizobium sp. CCBAU 21359]
MIRCANPSQVRQQAACSFKGGLPLDRKIAMNDKLFFAHSVTRGTNAIGDRCSLPLSTNANKTIFDSSHGSPHKYR